MDVRQPLAFSYLGCGSSVQVSCDGFSARAERSSHAVVFTSNPLPSLSWGRYLGARVSEVRPVGGGGLCIGLFFGSAAGGTPSPPGSVLWTHDARILALALSNGSWWWRGRKTSYFVPPLAECLAPDGPSVGLWVRGEDILVCVGSDDDIEDCRARLYGVCDLLGRTVGARLSELDGPPGAEETRGST
mmetsp:Transcript_73105/g.197022  ORF Transcript_73105/g.197022 Transcript_73105/m.197022 type:complete len:188 (-) Transcript_73105:62-625(-)